MVDEGLSVSLDWNLPSLSMINSIFLDISAFCKSLIILIFHDLAFCIIFKNWCLLFRYILNNSWYFRYNLNFLDISPSSINILNFLDYFCLLQYISLILSIFLSICILLILQYELEDGDIQFSLCNFAANCRIALPHRS